jgi:hypothetical protein
MTEFLTTRFRCRAFHERPVVRTAPHRTSRLWRRLRLEPYARFAIGEIVPGHFSPKAELITLEPITHQGARRLEAARPVSAGAGDAWHQDRHSLGD